MSWEKMKLNDVCISISDGDHQPPPKANKGVPFVTISNITNTNQFDFSNTMFVPQEYYDGLDSKRKVHEGDVLYSVVGSFGIPVYIKNNTPFVFQRHIAILRPNVYKIAPQFLYYTMLNRDFYLKADATAIGAAQRTVSLTALRNMEIKIPHIETQKQIAKILSSYDNLIDNNQKQIKLLEEAAQHLYKEWFVDLYFPGYEDVPIVDGVPEGWKKDTLSGICYLKKITVLAGEVSPDTPYIGLEHMPRVDFCLSSWGNAGDVSSNKFFYEADDIIFGKIRPYFHKVGFALNNGVVSTDSFVMRAQEGFWGLLLMTVFSKAFVDYSYQLCKEGAKMPRADWNQMKQYSVLVPDEQTRSCFEKNIRYITRQIKGLAFQNRLLAEARDRLLPKLMSGELEV